VNSTPLSMRSVFPWKCAPITARTLLLRNNARTSSALAVRSCTPRPLRIVGEKDHRGAVGNRGGRGLQPTQDLRPDAVALVIRPGAWIDGDEVNALAFEVVAVGGQANGALLPKLL
jgi:hypothetical protein